MQDLDESVPVYEVIVATNCLLDTPFIEPKYYGKCMANGDIEKL